MYFSFGLKSVVLLFFFIQGLIFSFLLYTKGNQQGSKAAKWLSAFILLCTFYIAPWMFGHAGWYGQDGYREFLFFMPFQQFFLMGPLILFYTRSLIFQDREFIKPDLLHFIPALIYLIYCIIIFITDVIVLDEFYFYADGRDKDLNPLYQISGLLYLAVYVILSIKIYNIYKARIYDQYSFAESIVFTWLKKFLISLLIILAVRILFFIFYPDWGDFGEKFWYYVIFAILAYYIGLTGYTNLVELNVPLATIGLKYPDSNVDSIKGSQITTIENLDSLKLDLEKLITRNKLYKNPTLTLNDIATEMDLGSKVVSAVINQGFNQNFNDLINKYRIDDVIDKFKSGEHSKYTLLSIALDSGFNSKATFNRAFKKNTSKTPLQYLKTLN